MLFYKRDFSKKKFSVDNPLPALYALSYFEDAEKERTPELLWKVNWPQIKSYILKETKKLSKEMLNSI